MCILFWCVCVGGGDRCCLLVMVLCVFVDVVFSFLYMLFVIFVVDDGDGDEWMEE